MRFEPEFLRHISDDIGLADRLAAGDGERGIVVCAMRERLVDEQLARRAFDGRKHALVIDPLAAQRHDQLDDARIGHVFAKAERRLFITSRSVRFRCSGVTEMRLS